MAKRIIKKKIVPKHILVVDTNELWQEIKNDVISEDFEIFWLEYAEKFSLELNIPEVVVGEILFQHSNSALKALGRANKQFDNMSRIAKQKYKHTITSRKVKKDVEKKLNAWLKSKSAIVTETPVTTIEWEKLIEKSIWREQPFTEDPNTEKGFRDALILETLKNICENQTELEIAFVSRDNLLRETAIEDLKHRDNLTCFESLEQFSSYLKLLDEKLTTAFIKSIQKRAKEKFFNASKNTGLLIDQDIPQFIRDHFSSHLSNPSTNALLGLATLSRSPASSPSPEWEELSDEGVWIQSPSFEELKEGNEYHWSSIVSFVQLFKYNSTTIAGLMSPRNGQINIRIMPFIARWKANVKVDGRFQKIEFIEVEPGDKKFEVPTSDDIERYRLGSHFEK